MLDPKFIRDNSDAVRLNTQQRNMDAGLVDAWLARDERRKAVTATVEDIRHTKKIGGKDISDEERLRIKQLKTELQSLENELESINQEWLDLLAQIPNMHSADVPIGLTDEENVAIYHHGEPTTFDFEPKNHVDITVPRGLINFERGAKVAGSQFYYLQGDLVLLEMALIQFVLKTAVAKGFTPLHTPDLARSRYYLGTGYNPRGDEAQTYEIKDEDLGLIATAEVTTAGYHADEILEGARLPLKYIALSNAYRKEAGAYGKYSKGLYRVHQFTKLELFVYCRAEDAASIHAELLELEKSIMESLNIPYRVLNICSGDLGAMAIKKYDVEAWMPGRNDYGEVTSASNCGDYQARNLNIRYRDEQGVHFASLLNGTAAAMSRTLIAVIENYQQADGTIKIPEVLRPYMPTDKAYI